VTSDDSFARFVALACHDLRTPLATVGGFANTVQQIAELGDPAERYVGMIASAAEQMAELLDELGLVSRIEAGRYEPALTDANTEDLARAGAERIGEKASASGSGAEVRVDREPTERAVGALGLCAQRHGALDRVEIRADGPTIEIEPVLPEVEPIILGQELKDFGAAAAVRLVEAIGGSVSLDGERLLVRLPAA
jgi:signal transduction histidine kinase